VTALLLVIVGVLVFASGFFAGAVCMATAMHEVRNPEGDQ
jgi:hypothetical protein